MLFICFYLCYLNVYLYLQVFISTDFLFILTISMCLSQITLKIFSNHIYVGTNMPTGYTCVSHTRWQFVFGNATDSCPICCCSCCRLSACGCSRSGRRGKGQRNGARCSSGSNRSSRRGAARGGGGWGNIWLWYAHKSGLCPSLLASSFMTCNNKSNNEPGPSHVASQRGKPVSYAHIRVCRYQMQLRQYWAHSNPTTATSVTSYDSCPSPSLLATVCFTFHAMQFRLVATILFSVLQ